MCFQACRTPLRQNPKPNRRKNKSRPRKPLIAQDRQKRRISAGGIPPRGTPAARAACGPSGRAARGRTPPEGGASPRAGLRPTRGLCGASGSAVGYGTSKSDAIRNDPAAEEWQRRCGALPHTPFRELFEKSPLKTFKNFWEGGKPLLFCLKTRVYMQTKAAPFLTAPLFYLFYPFPAGKNADRRPPRRFRFDRPSEGCRTAGRVATASAVISACF